jgi:endonuclease YncB( thermonuclease family)
MRFWRKKSDGFEWHQHVRTTVKLRREDRKRRIEVAKAAAVDGIKDVGRAGVAVGSSGIALAEQGAKSASTATKNAFVRLAIAVRDGIVRGFIAARNGIVRAGIATWRGASAGAKVSWHAITRAGTWTWNAIVRFFKAIPPALVRAWFGTIDVLDRLAGGPLMTKGVQSTLGVIAAIAGLVVLHGWMQGRMTVAVLAAAVIGVIAGLLALLPFLFGYRLLSFRWITEGVPAVGRRLGQASSRSSNRAVRVGGLAAASMLLVAGVAGAGWGVWQGTGYLAGASPAMPRIPGFTSRVIEGRAHAVSGDTIRIGDQIIELSGVEAPELGQRCSRPGDARWRCGDDARRAVARVASSGPARCTVSGNGDDGRVIATCTVKENDIAEDLVRNGHVFATTGLFAAYASLEQDAQAAKRGLWRGDAVRPSEYRARLAERRQRAWDQAKQSAPNGCPIKGQVVSGRKYYVLPGADDYARIRIRAGRGERWFCSEQEASAAGWKLSPRS